MDGVTLFWIPSAPRCLMLYSVRHIYIVCRAPSCDTQAVLRANTFARVGHVILSAEVTESLIT